MSGDLLDLVLVGAVLAFGFSGYRQGFIVGVLGFLGFLGGGVIGARFAPAMAQHLLSSQTGQAILAIAIVFVAASIGQVLTTTAGAWLRSRLRWRPARIVDSSGGAVVSAVSVLLVAWLVGTAVAHSPFGELARQVRHSYVLQQVDRVMPDSARGWFAAFRRLVDQNGFPQVFGGIGPERIHQVAPPDPALAGSPVVRQVTPSIVKIVGVADSCSRRLEGSGFVYAPNHVMTNAHVVAGVSVPTVQTSDGTTYDARVVLYDPEVDVAVLDVPGLHRPTLAFGGPLAAGDGAIVAGYPEDGPFTARSARIRGSQEARGPDIYQSRQVTRQIYSIRSQVLPGNSGGPLLTTAGQVAGVVFAAAVDDPDTGYALTAAQVSRDAAAGAQSTTRVGTGGCD